MGEEKFKDGIFIFSQKVKLNLEGNFFYIQIQIDEGFIVFFNICFFNSF